MYKRIFGVQVLITLLALGCAAEVDEPLAQADQEIVGGFDVRGLPPVGMVLIEPGSLCSGTLITPTRVVTAAHCLVGAAPSDVVFATGPTINEIQTRTAASRVVVHPSYNDDRFWEGHDIGYIDLVAAVPGVAPLGIVQTIDNRWLDVNLMHVGYGLSNAANGTGAGTKRGAMIPVASITATQIESDTPTRSTCNGDSGGPALYRNASGQFFVVGITSWGDEACTFGWSTRVDHYAGFLGVAATAATPPAPTCSGQLYFSENGDRIRLRREPGEVTVWWREGPRHPYAHCRYPFGELRTFHLLGGHDDLRVVDPMVSPLWVYAGAGSDIVYTSNGNDMLDGGVGPDLLVASGGDDRLYGREGRDELEGNAGNDQLVGGLGADDLRAGAGERDVCNGAPEDSKSGCEG